MTLARSVEVYDGGATPRGGWGWSGAQASETKDGAATPRGGWGWGGASHVGPGQEGYSARDDTDGHPDPPCERQVRRGVLKTILWPVDPGVKTFSIWVRHSGHSPYPRVIVKANPEVGVLSDQEAVAGASTDWQQLSVTVTVTAAGALQVWREVRAQEQNAYAKWDDISVS